MAGEFSSAFKIGADLGTQRLQRQKLLDDQYGKIGEQLYQALLEPDEKTRSLAVDSILQGAEQLSGRPVSKNFRAFLRQDPESAAQVLQNIQSQGVDPKVLWQVQDNPLLFGHAMIALGRAKRERQARTLRGNETGEAPAPGSNPASSPQPEQLSGPGTDEQPAITPPVAPAAASAPATVDNVDTELSSIDKRIAALTKRIEGLAGIGSDERNITPLRTELASLQKERRDIVIGPELAARTTSATEGVKPVSYPDVQIGVEAAQRAGQPDIAARFKPGMPRKAYDELMNRLGTTQNAPTSASEPTSPNSSPYTISGNLNTVAAPQSANGPKPLVQTQAEALTEKQNIERRSQPLKPEIARDPAVIAAGIKTQGELEDALAKGLKLQTAGQVARSTELASSQAKATVKDFETIKDEGASARRLARYYDVLAGAGSRAGARGPWLTPFRESLNSAANLLGIKDPWNQSNLQIMEAYSNKLIPELTKQFKGSQSDREFLAGLASAPSTRNNEKGFAVLLYTAREINNIGIEFDLQARKWVSQYGSLDSTDAQGRDFQTAFDDSLADFEAKNGDLQKRVEKAFGQPVNKLLGTKPGPRSDAGSNTQVAGDIVEMPQIVVQQGANGKFDFKIYDSNGLRGQGSADSAELARSKARQILIQQRKPVA